MKPSFSKTRGWTITETLMAASVMSVMTAGLVIGAYTIQRSYLASRHHIAAQAQQMRVMDYVNLDLRRALSADRPKRGLLVLTIPDYYEGADKDNYDLTDKVRDPQIKNGTAVYGGAPKTVQYYKEGDVIYRQQGAHKTALASGVQDFDPVFDPIGDSVAVSITFLPTFQLSGKNAESVRGGTATYSTTLLRNKRTN